MRRHVAIPVRSAVTATLLMAGAIYAVTEVRTAARRHETEASNVEPSLAGSGSAASESVASLPPVQAAPAAASIANPKQLRSDEVAAEKQAAKLPAPKPPKKAADKHTRQVIISLPDRRLALLEDGELVKVYAVAVGATESPSPGGEFTIINQVVNPSYYHEGKEIAAGKNNPLGTRWVGLSAKGYGIHGTNVQSSVGKAASHGCFRMKKKDMEELYARLQVGDTVSVRSERDELTAGLFTAGTPATVASANTRTEMQVASAATTDAVATTER